MADTWDDGDEDADWLREAIHDALVACQSLSLDNEDERGEVAAEVMRRVLEAQETARYG